MKRFAVLLFALPAFAAVDPGWTLPLFSSEPAEVYRAARLTSGPRDAGAYIIDLDMSIHIEDSGKMRWVQRSVTRIVDERGVRQFGTITIPFVKWRQERPRLRARVITRDGRPHDLDPSAILEGGLAAPGGQFIVDTAAISAPLPGIQSDSVLEVELEQDDKTTVFPGGQFMRYPITQSTPILHYRVSVQAPLNRPFHALGMELDGAERNEERAAELRSVTFEGRGLAPRFKPMLPPEHPQSPSVLISSGVSWRDLAAWYGKIVDERAGPPAPRETAPRDAAARIAAILAEIQSSVRYTGLELGAGAYLPRRPDDTLRRGFGDCKDKSVLLIQRLRAENIPAFLALLTPYPAPEVNPDLPGIENFTHAIVFVPGERPLWIDPSADYTPATRLPFMDQGRLALVAGAATTQVVRTPESVAGENLTRFDITVRLQPEGESIFEMMEQNAGAFEELVRPLAALSPERVREEKGTGLKRKISVDLADPRDLSKPYEISVAGEGYDAGRTEGTQAWADVSPLGVDLGFLAPMASEVTLLREMEGVAARTQDYCFPVLFTEEMEKRIVPPPGFTPKGNPALPWREIGPLTLARSAKVESDGSVRLSYRLVSTKRCYSVSEARTMAREIHQLSTSRDATVRIEFVKAKP